jgi:hypothetical protein
VVLDLIEVITWDLHGGSNGNNKKPDGQEEQLPYLSAKIIVIIIHTV